MTVAALTPRVRILVVCDEVIPSETEAEVFALVGVRQRVQLEVVPSNRDFYVFLLLSCPRQGTYQGWVRVVVNETMRTLRWVLIAALFEQPNQLVPIVVEMTSCRFLDAGEHTVEVWLTAPNGDSALKGELPLIAASTEE